MEESDISFYSNLTSVDDTILQIISTNDLIPRGSKYLKITDTFYTYLLETFIPTGNSFSGGWTAFCPAFFVYSAPVNPDFSSQTKPSTIKVKPATTIKSG